MACDKALLVHAYLDGELDPVAILEIEAHLGGCADCRQLVADTAGLRDILHALPPRHPAPAGLALRIGAALDQADASTRRGWPARLRERVAPYRQWLLGAVAGAAVAAAIAAALVLWRPPDGDGSVDELADAHLRSLMPDHLVDVASSDRKTLVPWLKQQVDAATPVIDLHAQGFDLQGARTDVIDGRRVAVVVYRQASHVVNLFVWSDYELDHASLASRDGYNLFMWPQRHLAFCAVSDLGESQLRVLARGVNAGMAAESN